MQTEQNSCWPEQSALRSQGRSQQIGQSLSPDGEGAWRVGGDAVYGVVTTGTAATA